MIIYILHSHFQYGGDYVLKVSSDLEEIKSAEKWYKNVENNFSPTEEEIKFKREYDGYYISKHEVAVPCYVVEAHDQETQKNVAIFSSKEDAEDFAELHEQRGYSLPNRVNKLDFEFGQKFSKIWKKIKTNKENYNQLSLEYRKEILKNVCKIIEGNSTINWLDDVDSINPSESVRLVELFREEEFFIDECIKSLFVLTKEFFNSLFSRTTKMLCYNETTRTVYFKDEKNRKLYALNSRISFKEVYEKHGTKPFIYMLTQEKPVKI